MPESVTALSSDNYQSSCFLLITENEYLKFMRIMVLKRPRGKCLEHIKRNLYSLPDRETVMLCAKGSTRNELLNRKSSSF